MLDVTSRDRYTIYCTCAHSDAILGVGSAMHVCDLKNSFLDMVSPVSVELDGEQAWVYI